MPQRSWVSTLGRRIAAATRVLLGHPSSGKAGWWGGGATTHAGVAVDETTALRFSAVLAAVDLIAGSVGSLPLGVYRKTRGRRREQRSHPAWRVLHDELNPEMTAIVGREALQAHALTHGNLYAEIEFRGDGDVAALWPLLPDRVTPTRRNGRIVYDVRQDSGPDVSLPARKVLHVPNLGYDGLVGRSPIRLMAEAIGLGMAAEKFGARFFVADCRAGAVLEHPSSLTKEAQDRLKKQIQEQAGGPDASHGLLLLEEGLKLTTIAVEPEAAQLIETRRFQLEEVARVLHVPPHMLGDLEKATFSNIEHQAIEYVVHCLGRWLERWEQELNRKLFAPGSGLYARHTVDGLLRGDQAARYTAYQIGRYGGWLSANDVRALEDMGPIEGGDVYWQPSNMGPARASGAGGPLEPEPDQLRAAHRRLLADRCENLVRRETSAVGKALKNPATYDATVAEFYGAMADHVRAVLGPAIAALTSAIGPRLASTSGLYTERLADWWFAEARFALSDPAEAPAVLARWDAGKAAAVAGHILDELLPEGKGTTDA